MKVMMILKFHGTKYAILHRNLADCCRNTQIHRAKSLRKAVAVIEATRWKLQTRHQGVFGLNYSYSDYNKKLISAPVLKGFSRPNRKRCGLSRMIGLRYGYRLSKKRLRHFTENPSMKIPTLYNLCHKEDE